METGNANQEKDRKYIRRCIQLARNGVVGASPNPMVGAVVVCDGRIVGEGYHRRCGGPHAEVNAIASVRRRYGEQADALLQRSTIYVSLEPCAHYGKTPPCAQLIIDSRIPRVVVGCRDPFAKVDGLGIKMLQDAGIDVTVGVLEQECRDLNTHFMTRHTLHRPHITLKWAQSQDGFIASADGAVSFSSPLTRCLVHKLRAESDAILVGARTVAVDNPSLTTRYWAGRQPLRVVIDMRGTLSSDYKVFDGSVPTRVYVGRGVTPSYADRVDVVEISSGHVAEQIVADLDGLNIQSLIVEGGTNTLNLFLDAGLWDEIRVETAPFDLSEGVKAPVLPDGVVVQCSEHDGREIKIVAHSLC